MFDFIRKTELWRAWDDAIDKELPGTQAFHLKTIQDLAVYARLRGLEGKSICEVGGGDSRLLRALSRKNRCANLDKFDGSHGGPKAPVKIPGVTNHLAYLGEFSREIPDASFDVVFSVSVVEHVPAGQLDNFLRDGLRILKPGGMFLHAIDIYVEDEPTQYWLDMFSRYRAWFAPGTGLEPVGNVYDGPLSFSCDIATNPDNVMYSWGKISPVLIPLRQVAQSVSLLLVGVSR